MIRSSFVSSTCAIKYKLIAAGDISPNEVSGLLKHKQQVRSHALVVFIRSEIVERNRESEWASEASSITSSGKVRSLKRTNDLHSLIDKREIKGKNREEGQRGKEKEKRNFERGQGLTHRHEVSLVTAVTEKAKTQPWP